MKKTTSAAWLQVASGLTVLFGLVCAAASFVPTQTPWLMLFDLLRWPVDGNPPGFDLTARPLNAVLGGVMVGWGMLMLLLVRQFFDEHDAILRKLLLAAVLSWFAVDCSASILAEIPGNLILNLAFLVMFTPPLIFVKKNE